MSRHWSTTSTKQSHPKNAHLAYLKSSTMYLSPSDTRKKRRVKSRILHQSRNVSGTWNFVDEVSLFDLKKARESVRLGSSDLKIEKNLNTKVSSVGLSFPRPSGTSTIIRRSISHGNEEKLPFDDDDAPIEAKPIDPSRREYWSFVTDTREARSNTLIKHNISFLSVGEESTFEESDHISVLTDDDLDIRSIEEDDETLPPYYQIIPELFYKFAGISQYSDSNQLLSEKDFKELLKCLGLEALFEDFLVWFPKPKLKKIGQGYISFDMFCDMFSCKFAQVILESRCEYETLCSAILTMKCLDKKNVNRIGFQQFFELCHSLYGGSKTGGDIKKLFEKYDTNGVGLLTIVNVFNFCCDEDETGE